MDSTWEQRSYFYENRDYKKPKSYNEKERTEISDTHNKSMRGYIDEKTND